MKKILYILCAVMIIAVCFSACRKKDDKSSAENTSVSTEPFTVGTEVTSITGNDGENKNVAHRDEDGNDLMIDHYDSKGKIDYYEEPVYDSFGSVERYNYYDKDKNLIAASGSANKFYDKDGKEISENDFVKIMSEAGIY